MTYPLWTYIVEILCIGGIVLGHIFLFYEIYKGITENDERICRTIAEHLGEYMAYKESIGEGADNEVVKEI